MSNPGATRKKFRAVRRYRRREHAEAEEEACHREKKILAPAVMENLMRQAQEEDYRREQMAAFERSARSHFADFGGEDGG